MYFLDSIFEAILSILLSCFTQRRKRIKTINLAELKEKKLLKFVENNCLLSECCLSFIYPFKILELDVYNKEMILERDYYLKDLEEIIHSKELSKSKICSIICSLCNIVMILNEYDVTVGNLKSSNIIYEYDGELKLCDLCLNVLRKEEEMRVYDICFKSPEELNGYECDDRSVIWSIGCILYEMMFKKLPFNEDDNMNKTKENIMRCKYILDVECDISMKEIIKRMLKVKNKDRFSLKELKKEMIKVSEIMRDTENGIMMCKERKEINFNNDYLIEISPYIENQTEYYLKTNIWEYLIEMYNNKADERILAVLFKRFSNIYITALALRFQIPHQCKYWNLHKCYLDRMLFNICYRKGSMLIMERNTCILEYGWRGDCFCCCKEGMDYFFRVVKLINPTKLIFCGSRIPIESQSLFGSLFSKLSYLEELKLYKYNLTSKFIESFVKSIRNMKLRYVNLHYNPIGLDGLKLLLPHLHLLINKDNELDVCGMSLNDESMMLLSSEIYKHQNLKKIFIADNNEITSETLKSLPPIFTYTFKSRN